ncbi:hypothetical protein CCR94_00975 [Rhodoblastus sphagnicola]|uniref:Arc-like DNA binding domain-containing protein n=1 Tax=Rhodoblastus sphagnicola TaxID=333368 RepID=A0A2S6NGC8_9HYPH|nr:Arc family DNA-binding protein [Rhodoblastus sphagnicola]MBB4200888.1 hypothetical protein [Rhodoblastus sphagnicola]PPQ33657.1 hypothetical protein CCR94_00975 [Rhodoblastus sphagnicola]
MAQDSPSRHLDQFVVRLPDGVRERIAELAKANNRSMNGEIVTVLERALRPSLSGRHHTLLDQVNSARLGPWITPSKIAELIGEKDAKAVEDAFAGKRVLEFSKIDAIANLWGARSDWLKHGFGAAFRVRRECALSLEAGAKILTVGAKRIVAVQSNMNSAECAVIGNEGTGRFVVVEIRLCSDKRMSQGVDTKALYVTSGLSSWSIDICARIDDEVFRALVLGYIYPGVIVGQAQYLSLGMECVDWRCR